MRRNASFVLFIGIYTGLFFGGEIAVANGFLKNGGMVARSLSVQKYDDRQVIKEQSDKARETKDGKALYQTYCAGCHKDSGEGIVYVFPPLKQNEWVKDENKLIDVILNGMAGGIVVNGHQYNQPMPAFSFLQDGEIAAIVNYVRKSFGNNYKEVSIAKVQEIRNKATK